MPIGVRNNGGKFIVYCFVDNKNTYIGTYNTVEEAFNAYKSTKESIIKQVAQEEYSKGNITKQCYEAMINYQVKITDWGDIFEVNKRTIAKG